MNPLIPTASGFLSMTAGSRNNITRYEEELGMKMEDMVLVSVDDHITEPGTVFDNQLSGEAHATAPKLKVKSNGVNYWEYQGKKVQSVALNAVTGRVREEYGMEPTALNQLRAGCYD